MATSTNPHKMWQIVYWYVMGNYRNPRKPSAIRNQNTIGAAPNGSKTRSFTTQSVWKPTKSTAKRLALDDLLKNVLIPDHDSHGQYGYSQLGLVSIQGSNSV
jgi:hypothetical protein